MDQERQKPSCPLIGQNGNIFHLMGLASRTLRQCGMADEAKEMQNRIMGGDCHSYEEALRIISECMHRLRLGVRRERGVSRGRHRAGNAMERGTGGF